MKIKREWTTPITAGAFLLSAVTGILMFFHLESGFNKVAHEWMSWAFLTGVTLHSATNFASFKRHLLTHRARWLIGAFALILALTFVPAGGSGEPPFVPAMKALARSPISNLALVAELTPEQVVERLAAQGVSVSSHNQSIVDLVGTDVRAHMGLIGAVFAAE